MRTTGALLFATRRILTTLEKRVPMAFPEATSLENLLKHIQDATRGRDSKTIPIYVDPIGFSESEKTLKSRRDGDRPRRHRSSARACAYSSIRSISISP